MEVDSILKSVQGTSSIFNNAHFPKSKGIYGIFLMPGKIIKIMDILPDALLLYIGISKNLYRRDFKQHFTVGRTGSSSFRRALGAVLKSELILTSIPRGVEQDEHRYSKYRFSEESEVILSNWMKENLIIGYWCAPLTWSIKDLRVAEFDLTTKYKPVLDRDPRTRRFNPYAPFIDTLAAICIDEAKTIAVSNDRY